MRLRLAGLGNGKSLGFEYGELLPKTGVYLLPDFKVVSFLRMLDELSREAETNSEYQNLHQIQEKFKLIQSLELQKQTRVMQARKMEELISIQNV